MGFADTAQTVTGFQSVVSDAQLAAIRDQLERIVASSEFVATERGRKFLKFVVEETLAGRGQRIKGYSIATQVFGRGEEFDAQNDPVVRIEAGRVRRALERYYLVAGTSDGTIITIPKGGYVPVFGWRSERDNPADARLPPADSDQRARSRAATELPLSPAGAPGVRVVPFADLGGDPGSRVHALGFTAEVIHQLTRFKELLVVVGHEADIEGGNVGHDHRKVRYALEGSVRSSQNRVRFAVRLTDRDTGAVLWSDAYDGNLSTKDIIEFQEDTAQRVATIVGQPYGVVFRADLARMAQHPDDVEAYSCTLAYFAYRADLDPRQHAVVRDALERVVKRFPDYATAWALLSLIYLDEDRFGFNPRQDARPPLERALDAANRAVHSDPNNVRALHAQMLALFFNKQVRAAFEVGDRALALNPNDTELCSELGLRHVTAGDRQKGKLLLQQVLLRNPSHAGYYYAQLAVAALYERDLDTAVDYVRKEPLPNSPIYHLIAAAIYGHAGLLADAEKAGANFLAMSPEFLTRLDEEISKRGLSTNDAVYLVEGLRKAGLAV
jgi:TolB-like protein